MRSASRRLVVIAVWLGAVGAAGSVGSCGGARPTPVDEAAASSDTTTGAHAAVLPPAGVDIAHLASPIVDLVGPTSTAVLLRGALVKSDAPPTDAWDEGVAIFARAFCIGETCFQLVDLGDRAVAAGAVTAVGPFGACAVTITRARAIRAHLPARGESPPVDQAFVLLELGACAAQPDARLEAVFGGTPVDILSLRDASWQPASSDVSAALDSREEVNRALTPDRQRIPITTAEVPQCGITLARGLAVYWIRDGVVNQPFDAARFVAAGDSLYAFSYVEGLDPLLERLDRVTCTAE